MTNNISLYTLKGTDGKHYELPSYLEGIYDAIKFMKKVIYENESFHTTYTTANGKPKKTISSLGNHLKKLDQYSDISFKNYKLSPLIEFFLEEFRKHSISSYLKSYCHSDNLGVELFNDFIATMRKNAIACKLKKRVSDWESKPKKNMKRIINFEREMFEYCGRVMAVRLDLNYHKAIFTPLEIAKIISETEKQNECDQEYFTAGGDISTQRVVEGRVALDEVQEDRKRLFTNMKGKPSLFKHLIATVWCIECGRSAGYHMHVVFFFDGSQVKKHEHYAQKIGEYWKEVITQGRGYFENCNRNKEKHGDSWAFGEIDHWDTAKRGNLISALQYFCKTSQMVQVVPYAGCHLFGCGFVRRQRNGRGGRPRTKGVDKPDQQHLKL